MNFLICRNTDFNNASGRSFIKSISSGRKKEKCIIHQEPLQTSTVEFVCFTFFVWLEKETDGIEIRNLKANEGSHRRTPRRDSTHVGSRLTDGAHGGNQLQK